MMNSIGTRGLLFMAATMAAMGESADFANASFNKFKGAKQIKSTVKLTPKQLKNRAKEKRAKIARKINY